MLVPVNSTCLFVASCGSTACADLNTNAFKHNHMAPADSPAAILSATQDRACDVLELPFEKLC